jgi:hypothetical protein
LRTRRRWTQQKPGSRTPCRRSGDAPHLLPRLCVPTPACRTDAGDLGQRPSSTNLPVDPAPRLSRRHPPARPNLLHERPAQHASFSVRVTAQTHFAVLMGLRILPITPIVEAKSTIPRLGHAPFVLPAQAVWEGWRAIDGHRTNISHPPGSAPHPTLLRDARRADPRRPGRAECRPIVDVKHFHHAGIDLAAAPRHSYALVFATSLQTQPVTYAALVPCWRSFRRVAVSAASRAANHSLSVLVNPQTWFEVRPRSRSTLLKDWPA